ncbi:4Fe-4S dicluster domain-containing protein [Oleidesulfovibrio alaskensis]|uniref:4Fe-4S dicluster domain-containing protein n=1 Tax=Oleidesulfovibrio alaskensis TaxID=58180 RepID=UPI001A457E3F|nr:4Fe-4S dicluster domain-containing protein [Oleidesulfovibrio alaskensis]MBL3582597.1 4Fe-4S dicluster domain-containing protein [Oleidesulfovibrio alaskensis]
MSRQFISHDKMTAWLDALSRDRAVLVPMDDCGTVTFRPYVPGRKALLDKMPVRAPKEGVFPQTETLLRFKYDKDPENLDRVKVQVREVPPTQKAVVVGGRPCGARGQLILDRVYNCDTMRDPYYVSRRENTLYVTVACTSAESTCFCHSVGSGPDDSEGSDVLLVPVEGGYVAEGVTERGRELLAEGDFESASQARMDEAGAVISRTRGQLGEAHDYSDAPRKLLERFDDMDFWNEQAAICISCGACTYLCPTCYCFNMTDEQSGLQGKRLRTWDTCMSFEFTLEGSGHNPRPTKAHRLRNRMGHKFAYYPELHEGLIACCGCGRCIKSCPVSLDIRAVVQAAQNHNAVPEEAEEKADA